MHSLFAASGFDEQMITTYHEAVSRYLGRTEVTAIDIGYVRRRGVRSEDLGVRIHVKEKIDPVHLDAREMFPDFIGDVEIDVLVSRFANHGPPTPGRYVNEPERRDEVSPIQPGVSVGDGRETGTIGLFVQDRQSGDMCLLGCDHVIASDRYPNNGDPVFQPGKSDGPGRKVAELLRWHRFTGSAVARLTDGISYTNKPFGFDRPICGVREPKRGDILVKSGRTTAITTGRVDGVGDTYDGVGYAFYLVPDSPNAGNLELSWLGDSGAIWFFRDTMEAAGLHVKGEKDPNPANEYAVATSLTAVLEELRLQVPNPTKSSTRSGRSRPAVPGQVVRVER